MIRRPLLVAAAFAVSALVLFGALARITAMTLALERSEAAALQRATQEENVRIALWRLDATLTGLIALENTRPAARFRAASEPAGLPRGLVHARFEVGADRGLRAEPALAAPRWVAALPIPEQPPRPKAPQIPKVPVQQALLAPAPAPAPKKPAAPAAPAQPMARDLAMVLAGHEPWASFPSTPGMPTDPIDVLCNEDGQQLQYTQEALNTLSFQRRQELGRQATLARPASAPPGVEVESAFEARWLDGDLVLLRRVRRGDERLLQGSWLDWPALRAVLLGQVEAVAPASSLQPVGEHDGADPGRRLALLPARLIPGPMLETEPQDWTPVRLSLAAAWGAALLGLVGVGSLLKGAVTLSQRRADFVSAVTHELRTPLTTFRLYTEMLLDDMVPPGERPSYLETLKREADRLGHLVENVLTFSRLERRAAAARVESLPLGDLLERSVPRLVERAAQAGLALNVEASPELSGERVRVDLASAEQILFNLVDNACKYAPNPAQPTLRLAISLRGRRAIVRLHDHGPGIEPRERRRIFRTFHRSAARAAGSAPGVGLGLALSRRLARQMGGDLRLVASQEGAEEGASFELRLRRS
ncbi:MAG TPA: HAMP domain-containing sensor histidine kinase [Thermoanaerobaculia bacterium]|nr:HAMP domain-containing sensor histidine kinase [Thermoanaerobaculia bacterium]